MTNTPGTLVISLDFELMWGMFDKVTPQTYGENIRGVHEVVPRILDLFETHNIHATWATVGMLMYDSKTVLSAARPAVAPHYTRTELSAYTHLETAQIEQTDQHYFAPALVQKIITTPGQELASHTFSHFYCLEEQVGDETTRNSFVADCAAMQIIAKEYGQALTSIVFPRNQWSTEALTACKQHGITVYRGTENHFLYKARTEENQTNLFIRGLRLLDHYINISGNHTHTIAVDENDMINVPASRFLRPYSKTLSPLEPLRLRRIKKAMTQAAKRGEVFHLWWHPHNFGSNQEKNLEVLTALLAHYQLLQTQYGMESKTMQEVATPLLEPSAPTASAA